MAKTIKLTEKETPIMSLLWERGPMFVREIVAAYPEPRPHFNTISTQVRILEDKGFVGHNVVGVSYQYYAIAERGRFVERSLSELVSNFFNNSYKAAVSALVSDEKISVEELRQIIDMVEKGREK